MIEHKLVYLEVDNKTDLKNAFSEIRDDVEQADSRPDRPLQLGGLFNCARK